MANPQTETKVSQEAKAGGRVQQIAGNYTNTTNISFLLVGVLALGGLAWALNIGKITGENSQQTSQPSPASTK